MDEAVYEAEERFEHNHWWFVGRRELFRSVLTPVSKSSDVLDVGSSSGTNLRLCSSIGIRNVVSLDYSSRVASALRSKYPSYSHTQGDAQMLPFRSSTFDVVLATDLLEHLRDDEAAISEIYRVMKPGAVMLVTVPMFKLLWGHQDKMSHHLRRYGRKDFLRLFHSAGLVIERRFYFNFILFFPIFLARLVLKITDFGVKSENEINSPYLNKFLTRLFRIDCWIASRAHIPFGVSYLLLARKQDDA